MSCSRTQHGGGRSRTPDLSLWSPTLYHWATALPVLNHEKMCIKSRLQRGFFETCSKWSKWQEVSVDIKILSPRGCLSLTCCYIQLLNLEKMFIKSDLEEIFWKVATNDQSDEAFLVASKFECSCISKCVLILNQHILSTQVSDTGPMVLWLWKDQFRFLMLLHEWKLIQHSMLMYFQVCSNSAYPQHSGERYRTIGPLVFRSYWCINCDGSM